MAPEKDMDEPVNVDMEPEDALRLMLAAERRETESPEDAGDDEDVTA